VISLRSPTDGSRLLSWGHSYSFPSFLPPYLSSPLLFPLPIHFTSLPLECIGPLNTARRSDRLGVGDLRTPMGSGTEHQLKSNLVHFSIRHHSVGTNFVNFPENQPPSMLHGCMTQELVGRRPALKISAFIVDAVHDTAQYPHFKQ